ncbi:hypothetical protein, partial [Geothermobacter hydrogeniphilus]|uniref:hypothetical protein n=1 Tax=Geothermobacter hydrogeniphilus TaxID=1969733 RepID=UPI001C0B4AA7
GDLVALVDAQAEADPIHFKVFFPGNLVHLMTSGQERRGLRGHLYWIGATIGVALVGNWNVWSVGHFKDY